MGISILVARSKKMMLKNDIFWSGIGSGFGEPSHTPQYHPGLCQQATVHCPLVGE